MSEKLTTLLSTPASHVQFRARNKTSSGIILFLSLIVCTASWLRGGASAFTLRLGLHAPASNRLTNLSPSSKKAGVHPRDVYCHVPKRLSTLKYREHDASDTGTTLLKLDTRTPPLGYDAKEHIEPQPLRKTGINIPLIIALLANQAFVLVVASVLALGTLFVTDGFFAFTHLPETFHWAGGDTTSSFDLSVSSTQILLGAVGALPSILIGSLIEQSDKRKFANTNFSTIIMVMTIFGRRRAPPKELIPQQYRNLEFPTSSTFRVIYWSLVVAGATGFCEELVFRCEIPSLIAHYTGNVALALFGQALLFGLGHFSPRSNLTENGIVMSLQAFNGLCFGLLYILTGGDNVTCIIAHAIYDFQVFFFTWLSTNNQIEYADRMYMEPLPSDVQSELSKLRIKDDDSFRKCKRLFYTFDFDKNKTLTLSEVRKGISYLWLELGLSMPPSEKLVDDLFISYSEGLGKGGAGAVS